MDKATARELLRLYRPGTADDQDPQIVEALQLARQDPELRQWLDAQLKFDEAIRAKLKQIPVPADLKRRILRADAARRDRAPMVRRALIPLAAAALLTIVCIAAWSYLRRSAANDFAACRDRVVRSAQRGYNMAMTSTNLDTIHQFILQKQYPDYALTKPLAKLAGEGCATLDWRGRKVSMVCLNGGGHDLYLFVLDSSHVQNAPPAGAPQFEEVLHLMTASWAEGGKIYILAGPGGEADLKQYLN